MNLNLKLKISENFSRAAEKYDEHAQLQRTIAQNLILQSEGYVAQDSKILDIGSGTGFIAQILNQRITQLDIALGMCKKSSAFSPAICADIENLPFGKEHFDAVYSSCSLQWPFNLENSLTEVHRILRNSGHFIFTIFGADTLKELKSAQLDSDISTRVNSFYNLEEIKVLLKKAGFQIIFYDNKHEMVNHDSAAELLRSIRNIGAGVTFSKSDSITKNKLVRLEDHYRKNFTSGNQLYSTWEILYFICQK